jgi:surfeit locus 1 family protein
VSVSPVRQSSRQGIAVPILFMLVALATFVGLGTWQLQRKAWKEALIQRLEQRLSAAAVDLPSSERWSSLDPVNDEFRRVKFSAVFKPGAEALVYTNGSTVRADVSGPGYWVLAPARTAAGDVIVVNRGLVPQGRQDAATRSTGEIGGSVEIVGVMRWPEPRGLFTPADDPAHNLWFVRDPIAIADAKHWGKVAPFFVELESSPSPSGLPRAGPLKPTLRNEHLQYAITWYGLAMVVCVMFVLWLRGRRHAAGEAPY